MKTPTPITDDAVKSVCAIIGFGNGNVALAKLSYISRELELELGSTRAKLESLTNSAKRLSDLLRCSVGLLDTEELAILLGKQKEDVVLKEYAKLEYLIGLNENYHIVPCSGNCKTQEKVIVSKGSHLGLALCSKCFHR